MTHPDELPDTNARASGRRWEVDGPDFIRLVGRGGAPLGYVGLYDNGWGANIRIRSRRRRGVSWQVDGHWYRQVPGVFAHRGAAGRALLEALNAR